MSCHNVRYLHEIKGDPIELYAIQRLWTVLVWVGTWKRLYHIWSLESIKIRFEWHKHNGAIIINVLGYVNCAKIDNDCLEGCDASRFNSIPYILFNLI